MVSDKTYKITPEIIVEKDILFRIPLYQRLFTWEEKEIRQLLDDLKEAFDKGKGLKAEPYYLGMITVAEDEVSQNQNITEKLFDLIDGQQRITVTTLLAIVLGRIKGGQNWTDYLKPERGKRLTFHGRSDDQEYLGKIIEDIGMPGFFMETGLAST